MYRHAKGMAGEFGLETHVGFDWRAALPAFYLCIPDPHATILNGIGSRFDLPLIASDTACRVCMKRPGGERGIGDGKLDDRFEKYRNRENNTRNNPDQGPVHLKHGVSEKYNHHNDQAQALYAEHDPPGRHIDGLL